MQMQKDEPDQQVQGDSQDAAQQSSADTLDT